MNTIINFIIILAVVLCMVSILACSPSKQLPAEVATLSKSALSPDKLWQLVLTEEKSPTSGVTQRRFSIVDVYSQQTVFHSADWYRIRDTLYFLWDNQARVWVYSGDLGTFYWEYNSGAWSKYVYLNDAVYSQIPKESLPKQRVSAPNFLKRKRPRLHDY